MNTLIFVGFLAIIALLAQIGLQLRAISRTLDHSRSTYFRCGRCKAVFDDTFSVPHGGDSASLVRCPACGLVNQNGFRIVRI